MRSAARRRAGCPNDECDRRAKHDAAMWFASREVQMRDVATTDEGSTSLRYAPRVVSDRIIIGGLLAAVLAWILLNPELISSLPLLYAIAIAPTIVLVTIGSLRRRRKPQAFARRLDRLLSLEHGDAADATIPAEAASLYERLSDAQLPTAIEQSREFLPAAGRAGPHQFPCLRLVLHHPARAEDPWSSLLRTHAKVLLAAEMKSWEVELLHGILRPDQRGATWPGGTKHGRH